MNPKIQYQIINKIIALMRKIRNQLQQVGLSQRETALYFAERIFKTKYVPTTQQNKQSLMKTQLQNWLCAQSERKISVKQSLIQLHTNLEIENELINQYEAYEPEKPVVVESNLRRESQVILLETPLLKKRQLNSFWQRLREDENSPKTPTSTQSSQFSLLRDFEKELNESLMKTKMLKRLIQQKIAEELSDSYSSRTKQLHNMLALQSN